jgi:hypothetical protein
MTPAGSSISKPGDDSYREAGEQQAADGAAQDHGVPCAQSSPRDQGPGRVTRKRPTARVLRVTGTPPHGRFASLDTSGPAERGAATRRTGKCRGPPAAGVIAEPPSQATAQVMPFDLHSAKNILLSLSRTEASSYQEPPLIILGVILLIIGFIAQVAIIWTIGIIVVVVGAILALLGSTGHAVRGRRHYF